MDWEIWLALIVEDTREGGAAGGFSWFLNRHDPSYIMLAPTLETLARLYAWANELQL